MRDFEYFGRMLRDVDRFVVDIHNYEISDPKPYVGFKNLDQLANTPLERRLGCDIRFKLDGIVYYGKTTSAKCLVPYKGRQTYLENDIDHPV